MEIKIPPKGSDCKKRRLNEIINEKLAQKGWSLAELRRHSWVPKSTLERYVGDNNAKPELRNIISIILALELELDEAIEMILEIYPYAYVWIEAIVGKKSIRDANEMLYDEDPNYPLLTKFETKSPHE